MLKKLFIIIKKIIFGMVLLFGYNTFLSSFNVLIPINLITIIFVALFDIPGVIGIIIFYLLNY